MQYKRANVNGICGFDMDAKTRERLEKMVLMVPAARDIAKGLIEQGYQGHEYSFGSRYFDDRHAAYRAIGHMAEEDFESDERITEWLVSSLLDSASADYYYTYEKDWE